MANQYTPTPDKRQLSFSFMGNSSKDQKELDHNSDKDQKDPTQEKRHV